MRIVRDAKLGSKCSGVVGTRERSALSAQRVHTTPAFDLRATETILCHPVLVPRLEGFWVAGLRRGRGPDQRTLVLEKGENVTMDVGIVLAHNDMPGALFPEQVLVR